MSKCECVSEGIPCLGDAADDHRFCGNCLPGGDCQDASRNAAVDDDDKCWCGCGSRPCADPEEADEVDERSLAEAQLVSLARKHQAISQAVELFDSVADTFEEEDAAEALVESLGRLDEIVFNALYRWAAL